MHRVPAVLLLLFAFTGLRAQLGGGSAFRVLDIPSSARLAALGGHSIAVLDNDLNLALYNPALLNPTMGRQLALSYLPYFEDINIGYGSYAHHFDSIATTFSGTMQFVDYGTFQRTDETGQELGTFSAGEYVFQVGAARAIDSLFQVGANLKFITAQYDTYNSTAWAVDLGGVFHKEALGLTVSALLRNIGVQSSPFTDQEEKLPFEAQLGITYKFRHAPFRLGMTFTDLQQWDLTYEDPNEPVQIDPTTGEEIVDKVTFLDKAVLHLVPSAEIIFGPNFMLRLGYDFRRRQELNLAAKPGLVGLSFGAGFKVSKVHISYGFAQYHLAGISNTFTLGLRFADLKRGGA